MIGQLNEHVVNLISLTRLLAQQNSQLAQQVSALGGDTSVVDELSFQIATTMASLLPRPQ